MRYRKEIDGLRALAVLPVLFFHSGLFGMAGGYVGVDVFFVISGYLITATIVQDLQKGEFSIGGFYQRRARRILPALSVVLLFTTIAAFIFMPTIYLKAYSQSLVAAVTFLSNVFFYLTGGYFSIASDEKPLLHLWSVAVEEQFYLFFPIFIAGLWFLGKKRITYLLIILSVASLVLAQTLSSAKLIDANFYLIFSRAWELFAGAILALIGLHTFSTSKLLKDVFAGLGLALVVYSIFFFDQQTPFPSLYTLLPVSGTLLIIAFSDNTTALGKVLAHKLLVSIGLISYSLYLWHQPLFAFLRMKTNGEPSQFMYLVAITVAFILSVFSFKLVETPFRDNARVSQKRMLVFSLASLVVFLGIGLSGHLFEGFKGRFKSATYLETAVHDFAIKQCHTRGRDYLKPETACRYFGQDVSWASVGDSHAVELTGALASLLEPANKGVLHLSFSACPPALLFDSGRPGCTKWLNETILYLQRDPSIDNVLLGFRHRVFRNVGLLSSNSDGLAFNLRQKYWQSFNEIIRRLLASGKNVYVLYPTPELPMHIAKAVTPFSIFGGEPLLDLTRSISSERYFSDNKFILDKLDALSYGERLHAIKPFELLCDNGFCPAVVDGKALYFDRHHLSVEGANLLLEKSGIIGN